MIHLLYNMLLLVASPVIIVILLAKTRCRRGLPQRLGLRAMVREGNAIQDPARSHRPVIWVHAVSLGEVVAITPLVKELHRRYPDHRFVITTATDTGRDAIRQRLAGIAEGRYAPLDFPWSVSRAIAQIRPVLYVFIETELWPNLLKHLSRLGVPTIMVNGRLSSSSYRRQRRPPVRWLYENMLRSLSLCLMQSDRDVERIVSLGADPRSVRRTGNIKFDQPLPVTEGKISRGTLGIAADAPLLVAGSTHPIEEDMLLEAYMTVLTRYPSARLLLAPRHIERADAVESLIRGRGLTVRRRSAAGYHTDRQEAGSQVLILDSRGELAVVYQEATVAFVGGTFVPIGGHNLLEPAFWAKPVLFGPYTDHCVDIAAMLTESGGGRRVMTTGELTQQLIQLFGHPDECIQMGRAAESMVRQNQGALQATIDAIDSILDQSGHHPASAESQDHFPLMAG